MGRVASQTLLAIIVVVLLASAVFASDLQTPSAIIPATYFGLHIHHLDRPTPTPWPSVPVPEWRLWDAEVTWSDLEPNRGQWQFARLDRYVAVAQQHGTNILLTLGGSPSWASARPRLASNYSPGFTAEPSNMDDWRRYVKTVASRYKGQIQAYEIWNEPNFPDFWSGTMDQMLALTKEAGQIIHAVDPHAVVVSPSAAANDGIPWLTEFLKKGGGAFVDVIGFHFYVNPHTKLPEDMVPLIQTARRIMSENNLANMPLWNTEAGWLIPAHFESEELAGGFLARAFILTWAAGVQRFYWYAWDNRSLAIVTYKEDTHTVTRAGTAYKVIQQWLVGAKMDACTESQDFSWTCELSRSGKLEWIVWNPQGNLKFDIPPSWHVKSATPLLQDRRPLTGSSVEIGPVPLLLAAHS